MPTNIPIDQPPTDERVLSGKEMKREPMANRILRLLPKWMKSEGRLAKERMDQFSELSGNKSEVNPEEAAKGELYVKTQEQRAKFDKLLSKWRGTKDPATWLEMTALSDENIKIGGTGFMPHSVGGPKPHVSKDTIPDDKAKDIEKEEDDRYNDTLLTASY